MDEDGKKIIRLCVVFHGEKKIKRLKDRSSKEFFSLRDYAENFAVLSV
jgi:hypothetical protein